MKRKAKPERSVRLAGGELVLTVEGKQYRYRLTAVPAQGGRAFRLERLQPEGGEPYTVLLASDGRHTCTCPGHQHRGVCKHLSAMVALAAASRLAGFFVG